MPRNTTPRKHKRSFDLPDPMMEFLNKDAEAAGVSASERLRYIIGKYQHEVELREVERQKRIWSFGKAMHTPAAQQALPIMDHAAHATLGGQGEHV